MPDQKILLISLNLPPVPTAMATVVENIARQYDAKDMVLCGERPWKFPDFKWNGINNLRCYYITQELKGRFIEDKFVKMLQLPYALVKTIYLLRKHKCNNIFVLYPHEVFLLIAYLASLLTGKDLYVYLHNTYLENRFSAFRPLHAWFQKKVFKRAKHLFVMSEGMVQLYSRIYPEINKCSALVHTFNERIPEYSPTVLKENINFYFSGNVNQTCKEAAIRLFNSITSVPSHSITVSPASQKLTLEEFGINTKQIQFISVSRKDLVSEINKADIVLLPHGFTGKLSQDEYDTIFPTKTIEYLICGKPILMHGPRESFITQFMIQNNCAYVVSEPDPLKISEAIDALISSESLRKELVTNALKTAEMFYAPTVIENFKKIINQN